MRMFVCVHVKWCYVKPKLSQFFMLLMCFKMCKERKKKAVSKLSGCNGTSIKSAINFQAAVYAKMV